MGGTPVDITVLPGVVSAKVTPPEELTVVRPAGDPKVTTNIGGKDAIDTSRGQV